MKKKTPIIIIIATLIIVVIVICTSLGKKDKDDSNINNTEYSQENTESTESLLEDTEKDSTQEESTTVGRPGGATSDGTYDYGMTGQEMAADEDGILGGTVYYNEDNTTYIIWEVGDEAGQRFEVGDTLPDGCIYGGITKEDRDKLAEEQDKLLEDLGFFD